MNDIQRNKSLEKLNNLCCYLSVLAIIIEWRPSTTLICIICALTVLFVQFNIIPFINEFLLTIAYIITFTTRGFFYSFTYIIMIITLIIWMIMISVMIKTFIKSK